MGFMIILTKSNFSTSNGKILYLAHDIYNFIKQCVFVHVGPKNIPIGCLNLMQGDLD
jgi:hypothetical protein